MLGDHVEFWSEWHDPQFKTDNILNLYSKTPTLLHSRLLTIRITHHALQKKKMDNGLPKVNLK